MRAYVTCGTMCIRACIYVQWTLINRTLDNRMSCLVESNLLTGTESFRIPAVLKCTTQVNQLLNIMKLLWPKVNVLSGIHCISIIQCMCVRGLCIFTDRRYYQHPRHRPDKRDCCTYEIGSCSHNAYYTTAILAHLF